MRLNINHLTNELLLFVFLITWWFIASVINPELHYYLQQSAFLTNGFFFKGFTSYPGGIADYLSEFVSQFFYYKTFGSFLIVLVASLQGIIAINLVERLIGKVKLNFSIFSLILLLSVLILCNYHYPFYASIRLLITFGFVYFYTVLSAKYMRIRFFISFILALLVFYLAGGAALFTFALAVILIQIRFLHKKTDWIIFPLFALFSGAIPYLACKYIFLVDRSLAYAITHSKTPLILTYIPDFKLITLYAILPAYLLFAVLFNWFKMKAKNALSFTDETKSKNILPKGTDKKVIKKSKNTPTIEEETSKRKLLDSPILWIVGQFVLISVLSIGSVYFTFEKTTRDKIFVSFYAANEDWDNVIKTAESIKEYDLFTNIEYNRALANTGKLADNLFKYKQLAGSNGLFVDESVTSDVTLICTDQYYDLGFMHESQHWAFEAQTIFPNSPRLMKRMVEIYLVIGKYQLAEKFLNRLNDNILYRDWVAQHQKFIQDTTLVSKDPVFSWKRSCEPGEAFTANDHVVKLIKLLKANPANKMALDYLLCSTLLDGDLSTFKTILDQNKAYIKFPLASLWDQALILYQYLNRKSPAPDDMPISKEGILELNSFINAMKPFGNDWQSARRSLEKEYGTSYWYYIKCLNPKITKAKIKRQ